jgi:hypothetical protein
MTNNNLYYSLWEKFLAVIVIQMKNARNGVKEIKLFKSEFASLGKKPVSEILFNLNIVNGKLITSGTKVPPAARDLFDKLNENTQTRGLMENQHYNFNLGKDFVLKIETIPLEVAVPEPQEADAV